MKKMINFATSRVMYVTVCAVAFFAIAVAEAGATLATPTVDVEPLANGIIGALNANLDTILLAAGTLAGVFFVLRMAKRWFGARSSA